MNLNENSIKLIEMLHSDSEKLNTFTSLATEEEAYSYIVSLIPTYTRQEFEELKREISKIQISSGKDLLDKEELEKISGGDFLDNMEYVLSGYEEGEESVRPVTSGLGFFSNVLGKIGEKLRRKKKKKKKK